MVKHKQQERNNKMTYEQAYAEGFCKAAEVVGVDPAALVKRAQLIGKIVGMASGAGKALKGGAKRYGELLMGGKPRLIEQLGAGLGVEKLNKLPVPADRVQRVKNKIISALDSRLRRLKGGPYENPADVLEARKALATQVGTGIGLAGAGTALAMRDNEPPSVWERLAAKLNIGK